MTIKNAIFMVMTMTLNIFDHEIDIRLVDGNLAVSGLKDLARDEADKIRLHIRENKVDIIAQVSLADLDIEVMTTCLHGQACSELYSRRGDRPGCFYSGERVFDMPACPKGRWIMYTDDNISKRRT